VTLPAQQPVAPRGHRGPLARREETRARRIEKTQRQRSSTSELLRGVTAGEARAMARV